MTDDGDKMAEDAEDGVENALNLVVCSGTKQQHEKNAEADDIRNRKYITNTIY